MKIIRLCILFICLLSGCVEHEENIKKSEDYLYFLFVDPLVDHPIWEQSKKGFYDACTDFQVVCDAVGPSVIDTNKMDELFYQGIIQRADGIITQGVIDPILVAKAKEENIPVILVDSNMDVEKYAFFGKDFKQQAELMLNEIERFLGKDTYLNIAIQVSDVSFNLAQEQVHEIELIFEKHPGNFKIINISESKSDKVRAMDEWKRILKAHEEINVTINFAAESAEACAEVSKALNLRDDIFIFGVDNMESTIKYIRNGDINASLVTSFYEYGYKSVSELYAYHVEEHRIDQVDNYVKLLVVTQDNVDSYQQELEGNKKNGEE